MHAKLDAALRRMQEHFLQDERCLAMYVSGSLGKGCADEFSDIDVGVVVAREHYDAVKAEAYGLCTRLCGEIVAWLPEGEQAEFVNYAFLFEAGGDLLLCDLMLVTPIYQASAPALQRHQILFDKTSLLRVEEGVARGGSYSAADLSMTLRTYWVYAYLNGKYWQRRDRYKMLYVQYALFLQHVILFRAFRPEQDWGWWARDVQHLPEASREELLVYFGATTLESVRDAFGRALDVFSRDARSACEHCKVEYPAAMEAAVREHLVRLDACGATDRDL